MALSITPMIDPETRERRVIDFGVAAMAHHGLAYFLMDHEPPWVMGSTTRWLQDDEHVVALTMRGDTMKSDKLTIYTGLGAPHHQVQLRPADEVEGFDIAVGAPGGRPEEGAWKADALRDIRAIAVDATGKLWVAEGKGDFGRFTVWKTEGRQAVLEREIFGPMNGAAAFVDAHAVEFGGLRWSFGEKAGKVECVGQASLAEKQPGVIDDVREWDGFALPAAETLGAASGTERALASEWRFHQVNGRLLATALGPGLRVSAVWGVEKPLSLAQGNVVVPKR
jgi:hypothetical protein